MNTHRAIDRISDRCVELAALGPIGMGIFALGTWAADRWLLVTFGPGYQSNANSCLSKPVNLDHFLGAARQLGLYGLIINEAPPKPRKIP